MQSDSQRRIEGIRSNLDRGLASTEMIGLAVDALESTEYTPFKRSGKYIGSYEAYGGTITDTDRVFYSKREPVCKWLTYHVAADIFDNGFKVAPADDLEDMALNKVVQDALRKLKFKEQFTRLFYFERTVGWSVLFLAYTDYQVSEWRDPVYKENDDGTLTLLGERKIYQMAPYWPYETQIRVTETEESKNSLRFGHPTFYKLNRGVGDEGDIHWTRIIHVATRILEKVYEGEPVIDPIFDDAVGFRNIRWGEYQLLYRVGSGFPVIYLPNATRKEIQDYIDRGEFDNLNVRTFIVLGGPPDAREEIEFKGVQNVALDPGPYNEMAWDQMAIASRVPKDILRGASAGRITGSRTNRENYFKFISGEQSQIEPVVRELIDRLIDTKQITYEDQRKGDVTKDYMIIWNTPDYVSDQDKAGIELLKERANEYKLSYMTVDEVRDDNELTALPDGKGEVVPGLVKQPLPFSSTEETTPQEEPVGGEEPAEGEDAVPFDSLVDEVMKQ